MITNTSLKILMRPDGVKFNLGEYLYCITPDGRCLRGIVGAESDGMSGGKLVKAILQDRHTFFEAVFHDCCWGDQIEEQQPDGTWLPYTPTKDESDGWLRANILAAGGDELEAEIVYLGVRTPTGDAIFAADRAEAARRKSSSPAPNAQHLSQRPTPGAPSHA